MTIEEGSTRENGLQTVSTLEARLAYESQEEAAMQRLQEDKKFRARAEATAGDAPGETSWEAIDLGPYVDGTVRIDPPMFFSRSDGPCLLYAGKTHYFIGESESGKTWAALVALKGVLEQGLGAMFVDYEDDAATFVNRLGQLGVPSDVIRDRERVAYVHPDEALKGEDAVRAITRAGASVQPSLVVIDGVSEAMTLEGLNIDSTGDVALFHADMPRRWEKTGAAIVLIDHVVKAKDNRGSYAIGSQHKRAGVNGASYKFEAQSPIGRGLSGAIRVTVTKDRPGYVRQISSGGKIVGTLTIHSDQEGNVTTSLDPVGTVVTPPSLDLMRPVSRFIELYPGCAKTAIRSGITAKARDVDRAIDDLVRDGYVTVRKRGNSQLHKSLKPYA